MKKTCFGHLVTCFAVSLLAFLALSPSQSLAQMAVQDLFVMSYSPGRLTRIDGRTGAIVYSVQAGGYYVTQGPDGLLYAAGAKRDPSNGNAILPSPPIGEYGKDFGADGNLYTGAQGVQGRVRRVDVVTRRFSDFVSLGSGGLGAVEAVRFGPDGHLYVTEYSNDPGGVAPPTNRVLRYNGTTGAFIDVFATDSRLVNTRSLDWGPTGNLFVASQGTTPSTGIVVEFDGATGAFVRVFADGIDYANGLAFGPDGNLYVGLELAGTIKRYNGQTGAFIDDFASGLPSGLVGMTWATVTVPEPSAASLIVCLLACAAGAMRGSLAPWTRPGIRNSKSTGIR